MSLNSIQPQLSSLKTCQTDISTGMDIVSEVALDLVEAQGDFSTNDRNERLGVRCDESSPED